MQHIFKHVSGKKGINSFVFIIIGIIINFIFFREQSDTPYAVPHININISFKSLDYHNWERKWKTTPTHRVPVPSLF